MINYYDVLEVSEKASKEVIEKAYKALAKKYHPDLNHDNPQEAELKMKQLNEAYDVLINDSKRANFDNILSKKRELELQNKQHYNSSDTSNINFSQPNNIADANKISYSNNGYYTDQEGNFYVNTHNMDDKTKQKLQAKLQEKYLEAYDAYLRQHGYKLKYKWTFKRIMQVVLAVIIAIAIFTVLFFIPPIHKYFVGIYEDNAAIRLLVNLINSFFKAIFSIF